jgi:hypothetical protein
VKDLSRARLRQLANERGLMLDEDDLVRLEPMVQDLLAVADGLRERAAQWRATERLDPDRRRPGGGLSR